MRKSLSSVASSGQIDARKSATDLEAGNNPPADTKSISEVHISYGPDAPGASIELRGEADCSNGDTKALPALNKLAFKRDPPVSRGPYYTTQVDIIGVPAIGGHPEMTWTPRATYNPDVPSIGQRPTQITMALFKMAPMVQAYSAPTDLMNASRPGGDRTEPPWITRAIRNRTKEARVLLYDHGEPEEEDTLKTLATRLLKNIEDLRRIEKESRPIFFVCHSTGGLVVKMALAEASRSKNSILGDCYGVTFFSTPHRGSSYLSRPDFSYSISSIMQLSAPLPESISSHLTLDNPLLQKLDSDFKSLATEMQLWTFFETEDTDLSNEFHAPITSIKSALLNLRHEVVYPLLSDHANCANFGSNNQQTKESYLGELAQAIEKALELAKVKHTEMNLEDRVKVEINGFYEGAFLPSSNEVSMKVWSTTRTLSEFKRHGPAKLLEDRLSEINAQPKEKQYIGQHTRAPDLISDKKRDSGPPGFKNKRFRRGKSRDRSSRELKTTQHLAVLSDNDRESDNIVPSIAVVDRDGRLSPDVPSRTASPQQHTVKVVPSIQSLASDTSHYYDLPSDGTHLIPAAAQSQHATHGELHTESPAKALPQTPQRHGSPSRKSRTESGGVANMVIPAAFSRPDVKKQRLMWVHVPFNNPIWVKDIISTISIDKGRDCDSKLLSSELFESKHVRGRHAEHHACFLKPGCTLIGSDMVSPSAAPRTVGFNPRHAQMCLYLPYMHFDTYKALVKRRILIKRRIKQGRSRPVPQSIAKLESLELKVIWQYLGHDLPINCRRTLDQFGYPGLLDTRARDDDQMLYKMTKQRFAHLDSDESLLPHSHITEKASSEKSRDEVDEEDDDNSDSDDDDEDEDEEYEEEESEPEEDEEDIIDGNVLMVDQLWLWIVDSATTVTFFSKKEPLITDGRLFQQADLRNSIFNEVNADLTSKCENAFDFAALAALHAVTVIFERSSHPDLEIFRTFEEAISILTEKMLDSFKQFRARGFRDKTDNHDDFLRAHNIRAKHKEESRLAERQNRENTSALLELRDIEDELHTLEDLFETQKKTIELMISHYEKEELRNLTVNGLVFLRQADDKLEEYASHAEKMIEDVKATREDFDKLLQMVQRQAQVDEVRLQRLQTDLANVQSRSVTIFTVFTVIFLPLTFFTGLFGMNTREWGGGDFLHLKTIGAITLPSSFLIIALALIVAWSTKIRKVFNKIARVGKKVEKAIRKSTMHFIMSIPAAATLASKEARKRSMEERKEARRLRKEAKKEASWLNEDFWESHVTAREKDYRLPPQNRKSVSIARKKLVEVLRERERRKFGHLGLGKWEDEFIGKIRKEK